MIDKIISIHEKNAQEWEKLQIQFLLQIQESELQKQRINKNKIKMTNNLHDDIGSIVSVIDILCQSALLNVGKNTNTTKEYLQKIELLIIENNPKIKNIILNKPNKVILPTSDINKLFHNTALMFFDNSTTEFNLLLPSLDEWKILSVYTQNHLFLLYKEACNNIRKHAQATKIDCQISIKKKFFYMLISDNGIGFDTTRSFAGHGLLSMKDRANSIKGKIVIETKLGEGTTIIVSSFA